MKKIYFLFILSFIFIPLKAYAANVAEVDGTGYSKLSTAISKVHDNTHTTITLLSDVQENVSIGAKKNIVLDLNGHTLRNNGNYNLISSSGILEVKNGTLTSDADTKGMIDNNSGTLYVTNGAILIANGGRQAIYNNGGTVYISGDSYIEGNASARAAVHNLKDGTIYITGGKIVSNTLYGIYNEKGTVEIGEKNGICNITTPEIIGKTYGIVSNNKYSYKVYDGIIKGGTYPVGTTPNTGNDITISNDETYARVSDIEVDAEGKLSTSDVGGETYQALTFEIDLTKIRVTFDPNGGTVSPTSKRITIGEKIGSLPIPVQVDYSFDGWYTAITDGAKITEDEMPSVNTTYFAHWTYIDPNTVASVDGVLMSLKNAFLTGGNIKLEKDVIITENLSMNLESTLDLNGHIITLNNSRININEKVTIDDLTDNKEGKITSNASFTIIVGSNGNLIHKGGTIEGLGEYGAIRNYGTTEIDGGRVLGDSSNDEAGGHVIYNEKDLIMKSGTVYSADGRAVNVRANATFIMDGGLLKSDATNDQTVNLAGDCSATINGGTIEGLGHETAGIAMFGNTNLIVNGGTIKGNSMAIAGNGQVISANANLTINGGDLSSIDGVGLYLPQRDSLITINGGNISGPTAVELRASKLVVNGGNITGTNEAYESSPESNGTTTKGAGVAVSQHTSKQAIDVVITGGNIKAVVPLCNINPLNNPTEAIEKINIDITGGNFESTDGRIFDVEDGMPNKKYVSGGTYNVNPSDNVKDDYGVVKVNNLYIVLPTHTVTIDQDSSSLVEIDNNKYTETDTVELKNIKEKSGYAAVINIYDTNGNKLDIEVTNNKFTMPNKDIVIKITYESVGEVLGARRVPTNALTEKTTKEEVKTNNPTTFDGTTTYILISITSIIGIVLVKFRNKLLSK